MPGIPAPIDVAFTPAELHDADVAVVIDVLRATTTATQALAIGYTRVLMAETIERARDLRAPGRLLAGERRCVPPPGFDLGNSPRELRRRDDATELVLATTNGAPATVAAARHAPTVLLACLRNLAAVVDALGATDPDTSILLVCAGTDGAPALEDIYVAGRVCSALRRPATDAALVSIAVAAHWRDPFEALAAGTDAAMLRSVGLTDDIRCCAEESVLGTVPCVDGAADGVATVLALAASDTVTAMDRPRSTAAVRG